MLLQPLLLAGGLREFAFRYAVVPASQVIASHVVDDGGVAPRPREQYPSQIQGRAYTSFGLESSHLLHEAKRPDPLLLLDRTGTATFGPPLCVRSERFAAEAGLTASAGWLVVAGNRRAVLLQHLVCGPSSDAAREYQRRLSEFAAELGASPTLPSDAVLIRELLLPADARGHAEDHPHDVGQPLAFSPTVFAGANPLTSIAPLSLLRLVNRYSDAPASTGRDPSSLVQSLLMEVRTDDVMRSMFLRFARVPTRARQRMAGERQRSANYDSTATRRSDAFRSVVVEQTVRALTIGLRQATPDPSPASLLGRLCIAPSPQLAPVKASLLPREELTVFLQPGRRRGYALSPSFARSLADVVLGLIFGDVFPLIALSYAGRESHRRGQLHDVVLRRAIALRDELAGLPRATYMSVSTSIGEGLLLAIARSFAEPRAEWKSQGQLFLTHSWYAFLDDVADRIDVRGWLVLLSANAGDLRAALTEACESGSTETAEMLRPLIATLALSDSEPPSIEFFRVLFSEGRFRTVAALLGASPPTAQETWLDVVRWTQKFLEQHGDVVSRSAPRAASGGGRGGRPAVRKVDQLYTAFIACQAAKMGWPDRPPGSEPDRDWRATVSAYRRMMISLSELHCSPALLRQSIEKRTGEAREVPTLIGHHSFARADTLRAVDKVVQEHAGKF